MKKFVSLLVAAITVFSSVALLAGCGDNSGKNSNDKEASLSSKEFVGKYYVVAWNIDDDFFSSLEEVPESYSQKGYIKATANFTMDFTANYNVSVSNGTDSVTYQWKFESDKLWLIDEGSNYEIKTRDGLLFIDDLIYSKDKNYKLEFPVTLEGKFSVKNIYKKESDSNLYYDEMTEEEKKQCEAYLNYSCEFISSDKVIVMPHEYTIEAYKFDYNVEGNYISLLDLEDKTASRLGKITKKVFDNVYYITVDLGTGVFIDLEKKDETILKVDEEDVVGTYEVKSLTIALLDNDVLTFNKYNSIEELPENHTRIEEGYLKKIIKLNEDKTGTIEEEGIVPTEITWELVNEYVILYSNDKKVLVIKVGKNGDNLTRTAVYSGGYSYSLELVPVQ